MNTIEFLAANFWPIAGSVMLACIVAWLGYRTAYRGRRAAACGKFWAEVLSILSGLYPSPAQWPTDGIRIIDVLEAKFPALESAVTEFRRHLSWVDKWRFDRAWRIYRLGKDCRDIDCQYYWQYVPHSGEGYENGVSYKHDTKLTYQTDFRKNVDHLLSFANVK